MRELSRVIRSISMGVVFCVCTPALLQAESVSSANADGVNVITGAQWVSAPAIPESRTLDMKTLPLAPSWKPGDAIIEIPRQFRGDPNAPTPVPISPVFGEDQLALQQRNQLPNSGRAFGAPALNFDVLNSPSVSPNDPTGDIGTLQYVASVNGSSGALFSVYNKVTGALISGPTSMEGLVPSGICASGLGDPIVLFDELASRWVLTEFSSGGNGLCVYLSNIADLSGVVTWTRYVFTFPDFPDYPKYGVWPDAYYVGANEGSAGGQKPLVAMDRVAMLAGAPATMQRFNVAELNGFGFQMVQPADIAGTEVPAVGDPGIFMRHNDDEAHSPGSNNPTEDYLQMFEVRVNWTTPASSTLTGPITFAMPEFSSNLNGLSAFNAFPQPGGQKLDPLRETVMHRLTYRKFAGYESLVGNMVTDLFLGVGSTYPDDTGGVRWFELRRNLVDLIFADGFDSVVRGGTTPGDWSLYQAGTYAPADGTPTEQADRWMAGSSIDSSGNIGLAYNVVRQSPAISAGVRYTGRLAGDPPGVMTEAEVTVVAGSGNISNERWGDYNDMGVDPVDGCTFWFVGNYSTGGARTNRAVAFKHDACGTPTFTLSASPAQVGVCANNPSPTAAAPITLTVGSVSSYNQPVNLSFLALPTGVTASATPSTVPTLPGNSTIQLNATNAAAPGLNNVTVRGNSGAIQVDRVLGLTVVTASPTAPTLTAPANAATGVATQPTFTWAAVPQTTQYIVEASTSNVFATTLFSQTVTGTSLLSPVTLPVGSVIYWRVRGVNSCATGADSAVFSFTTVTEYCVSPGTAIPDNNTTGITSTIVVPPGGATITDLNVAFKVTHTWMGDLSARLSNGTTTIDLMARPGVPAVANGCTGDNADIIIDDEEPTRTVEGSCTNTTPAYLVGQTYRPNQPLTGFDGSNFSATWTLNVFDSAGQDVGTLDRWCLIPN